MEQCNKEFKPQDQQSKASSSKAEKSPSTGSEGACLKVVYVFAGHRRRADVREHLENLALASGFTLDMHELDLMRDPKHDVLQDDVVEPQRFHQAVAIFVSSQHPRARPTVGRHFYKVSPGPRPIRSRQYPLGYPWLSQSNRQEAEEGALLAVRAWELYFLAHEIGATYLGEFPEDLGATSTGVPASFWQKQQFQEVLALRNSKAFAIFQCEFGAQTPKPTRFVTDLFGFEGPIHLAAHNLTKTGSIRALYQHNVLIQVVMVSS